MSEEATKRGSEEGGRRAVVRTFRDLLVWQKRMKLALHVYALTKQFPADERFGLTSQLRRAAVSVPSNIAEGHARQTRGDYLRCLRIARGSLAEVGTQLELARELGYLADPDHALELCNELARMLQSLIHALERKGNAP